MRSARRRQVSSPSLDKRRAERTLLQPTAKTLAKYGLTVEAWQDIATRQGHVCAICRRLPASGRLHVDHFHRRGWSKLPADQRALDVRGLVCFRDNRYTVAGNTPETAQAVVDYLLAHIQRRALAAA